MSDNEIVFSDDEGSKITVKRGSLKKKFDAKARKAGMEAVKEMKAAWTDGLHMEGNKNWPRDSEGKIYETVYKRDNVVIKSHEPMTADELAAIPAKDIYANDGHVTEAGKKKYPLPGNVFKAPGSTGGKPN